MTKAYYLDSSALNKKYFRETGSSFVERLFGEKALFFSATLTYAEIYSTIYRIQRDLLLSKNETERIRQDFEKDWLNFNLIDFNKETRAKIVELMKMHPLRGADAVQLASAVFLGSTGISFQFVASDKKLLTAAKDYGFKVINPEDL